MGYLRSAIMPAPTKRWNGSTRLSPASTATRRSSAIQSHTCDRSSLGTVGKAHGPAAAAPPELVVEPHIASFDAAIAAADALPPIWQYRTQPKVTGGLLVLFFSCSCWRWRRIDL
jgi:hypothetical protein